MSTPLTITAAAAAAHCCCLLVLHFANCSISIEIDQSNIKIWQTSKVTSAAAENGHLECMKYAYGQGLLLLCVRIVF